MPPPATSHFLLASCEYHGPVLYFTVWSLVYGLSRFLSELQKTLSCYTSLSAPGKHLQAEAQLDTNPLETSTAVLLLQDGSSFWGPGPSQIPCCWSGPPPVPCCIANWGEENRLHWHGLGDISTTLLQGSLWTLMLSPANNPIFQKEAENQDQVTDLGENTSSVHLSSDTRKLVLDGEHCNSLWKMKRD